MPKVTRTITLTSGKHRSRECDRDALARFPGSLLHTAYGCLGPNEKELDLDVPWMTVPLLNALVDAHVKGKLLVPPKGRVLDIERLVQYARLPEEVLPVGLRRNAESKRLLEEWAPRMAAIIALDVENSSAGTWSTTFLFKDYDFLPKIKNVQQLTSRISEELAAHGIRCVGTWRGSSPTELELKTSW